MDWQAIFWGFIGGVLAAFLVLFFFPSDYCLHNYNISSTTILKIEDIPIASIPKAAVVVYKNSSVIDKLQYLQKTKSGYIFQSCVRGSEIAEEEHFKEAYEKTLLEVSMFLNSSVKSTTLYQKTQNKEFFNKVSEVFSYSVTSGSQILAKYKYIDSVLGYDFCVVTLYDPQEAFKAHEVQEKIKAISQRYGIDWKEFIKELQDAMKNTYNR
ncbi:MAG: hypothetical protein J7L34_06135 [Thermotogaceae bacterium]|nr:hypothetical protein [Thermotogaceae bacterium]